MNILVTGANGQLGSELRIVSAGSADNYVFTDIAEARGVETKILDITDEEAVRRVVDECDIDAVVNCAAYTDVERAEDNVALAESLNFRAPSILAAVMKERDGLLVHVSTDYVFGKEPYNVPCREDQKGTPTGVYGMTKLQGERAIVESRCNHIIIRTAWLYSEFGKNFLKTMLSLTSSKPEICVVFDQTGTPTYALDLAEAIFRIVEDRKFEDNCGIYHYSNEGVCSWFDFARMIAEFSGNTGCKVRPCHSYEYPSRVVRPSYSVLDKSKFKAVFGMEIPYWTDSLRRCIANIL